MKKQIFIAVCLLTITACTKKSSTTPSSTSSSGDSTFNGSYFQLSVNGKSFYEKDVVYKPDGAHLVTITETDNPNALILSAPGSFTNDTVNMITLIVQDNFNIYGLTLTSYIYAIGNGTGNYYIPNGYAIGGGLSMIEQANPLVGYSDTSGTVNVTHNGSDYISGTINANLYSSTGFSYPATGSFKIYH